MNQINMRDGVETIVKIQISLLTDNEQPQVLVYDENRDNFYEGDATPEILEAMQGELKKYFFARIPKEPGYIRILKEAPEQGW